MTVGPSSDTGLQPSAEVGQAFVEALGRKDFEALSALFDPEVDFRGLTPSRAWEATGPKALVDDVLSQWFEDSDQIERITPVDTGRIADREHIAYRFEVTNPDGRFIGEQQAYYTERDGRIDWMRVLCSGFRPR